MRLSEIDVATALRNMTPGEISAAAQGVDQKLVVDPKIKAEIEKKAQTYVKPLMGKWQEALAAQAAVGKDIDDVSTQRIILAGIISRYAGISPDDVDVLEKKILRSDLTDEQQVSDIFKSAVVMTLFQRIVRPVGKRQSTAQYQPSAEVPQEIPDNALVSVMIQQQPVFYYHFNSRWYNQANDTPLNPTKDEYIISQLNKKTYELQRKGKLKLRT